MKVIVNGEPRELPDGASVAEAVESVSGAASGIAVAVNDEVVRRSAWAATALRDADRIEVLTAVQGG
ncbi:sulfur carrier protein ThiS [Actinomadura sp. KC216]|uniref:sulfur carrier protein ThiS n=1 Tax=Actinomadura sp. KC216 TaxID=2530370 RepID=UPI00104FF140|nr:sulfur carrier protein ThiS [Actinomadura sp. KC216]TDB84162.1 sulfur carrier protein ThiS [Actinomadura sp. KC216]